MTDKQPDAEAIAALDVFFETHADNPRMSNVEVMRAALDAAATHRKAVSDAMPWPDTYLMPAHGWTCFHCGETFTTPSSARDHFGCEPCADPACRIKVGEERGLVMALRKAEVELERYRNEDSAAFFAPVTETPEPTAAQRAACLFAKTQADASGKPQSEVNAIVRESLENMAAKDVTEKEPTDGE